MGVLKLKQVKSYAEQVGLTPYKDWKAEVLQFA